ncbi:MAG: hypothetical protein HGA69_00395 [Desulfobulbaceae bacterium]|nr:hypothetical protein [Desulfobulbaceae bacterium]
MAEHLLKDYPMSGPRNTTIRQARLVAIDCILANIKNGKDLIVPNFQRLSADDLGFSRDTFRSVLEHLENANFIARETRPGGENAAYARSILEYSARIRKYQPVRIIFQPKPVITNIKGERLVVAKVNVAVRKDLKVRLKKSWDFFLQHEILPGINNETFQLFDQYQTEVHNKKPLIFPDPSKVLPYFVFNDRDLTMGGRMYGAFWIGESKILRRAIRIDGELTADIDGRAMHVQLLYRRMGVPIPEGDPYLFDDDRRSIAKKLMLLMMNTREEMPATLGRKAVQKTYRKHYGQVDGIEDLILKLESHHSSIVDQFYKPNWGDLQRTEAALILSIMEDGIRDGVVILPVHDGCLCQRQHKDKVLEYFKGKGIIATENLEHLQGLPISETREALAAVRRVNQSIHRKISLCTHYENV